jgi:outer membrane lipoprotein-sorting protein
MQTLDQKSPCAPKCADTLPIADAYSRVNERFRSVARALLVCAGALLVGAPHAQTPNHSVEHAATAYSIEEKLLERYAKLSSYCDEYVRRDNYPGGVSTYRGARCASVDGRYRFYRSDDQQMSPPVTLWSDGQSASSYDRDRGAHTYRISQKKKLFDELEAADSFQVAIGTSQSRYFFSPFTSIPTLGDDSLDYFERNGKTTRSPVSTQRIGVSKQDGLIRYVENVRQYEATRYVDGIHSLQMSESRHFYEISNVRVDKKVGNSDFYAGVSIFSRIFQAQDWQVRIVGTAGIAALGFALLIAFIGTGSRRPQSDRWGGCPNFLRRLRKVLLWASVLVTALALFALTSGGIGGAFAFAYVLAFGVYPLSTLWSGLLGAHVAMKVVDHWCARTQ